MQHDPDGIDGLIALPADDAVYRRACSDGYPQLILELALDCSGRWYLYTQIRASRVDHRLLADHGATEAAASIGRQLEDQ